MSNVGDGSGMHKFSSVFNQAVMDDMGKSIVAVEDGSYFNPTMYHAEEWFNFEVESIYKKNWLALGRVSYLRDPGDYFTVKINNDPMMVVMGDDGEIRVMAAVCQHRGMLLVEEDGSVERGLFRCPLHSWSYDLRGQLKHAPEMNKTSNFSIGDICLPQLKVELWEGWVFANYDMDAPPLAPTLVKLGEAMKNYDVENMVSLPPVELGPYPWNWKLMLENFMEPYHNAYLHKGIHEFALGHSFVEHDPSENVIMHPTGFDRVDASFNPIHQSLLPVIPTLTQEERSQVMFAMIPPMMPLGLMPDHIFHFLVLPNGPNEIKLRVGLCFPPGSLEVQNFGKIVDWIVDGIMMYNDQDVVADTATQIGLKSSFAPRGRFSWKETTIAQLNRWLFARYRDYGQAEGLV